MENRVCDVVVIGSGAGGAVVAHRLAEKGLKVILLEAGGFVTTNQYTTEFWPTMKHLFWDFGFQFAPGVPAIPFLQGRTVGGTTAINSAICWDMPQNVFEEWVQEGDFSVRFDEITAEEERLRRDLCIRPVDPAIAGGNNNSMARGAAKLGWKGRVVERNEKNCRGSGRCPCGCPNGAKLSMEISYIPWAIEKGLELIADCEAERVLIERGEVVGVLANKLTPGARQRMVLPKKGVRFTIKARRVIVSAGVIQSPLILQRSDIPDPDRLIGSNLMAHPGTSIVGRFDEEINLWNGATQGYEVTEFRPKGLKLESLGVNPALFGIRLPGSGRRLARLYEQRGQMALWAAAVRTESRGSVRKGRPISPIRFSLTHNDVGRFQMGIQILGKMMFAAGAREVYPGIVGRPSAVRSVDELHEVTREPIDASQIHPVATHLFGTCRISDDPRRGVVNSRFESHRTKGLFVADGSVFPTNIGVNPQLAIMAMAGVAAKRVAESL